jgi:hypothetical protein
MDKLLSILGSYLQAASQVIVKYSPVVWNATLATVRISSIFDLIMRALGIAVAIAVPIVFNKILKPTADKAYDEFDKSDKKILITVLSFVAAAVVFVIIGTSFTDMLGACAPQLYLLYHLAIKAGLIH